jgi:hypothetical protein
MPSRPSAAARTASAGIRHSRASIMAATVAVRPMRRNTPISPNHSPAPSSTTSRRPPSSVTVTASRPAATTYIASD